MKCEIERMEINYTFYFFAFLRKMIKKLLTFCYWSNYFIHTEFKIIFYHDHNDRTVRSNRTWI